MPRFVTHLLFVVRLYRDNIQDGSDSGDMLRLLAFATEYEEHPVRHNEDNMNQDLSRQLMRFIRLRSTTLLRDVEDYLSPHIKYVIFVRIIRIPSMFTFLNMILLSGYYFCFWRT